MRQLEQVPRFQFTVGALVNAWPVPDREFLSDGWLSEDGEHQIGVIVDYLPQKIEGTNRFSVIPLSKARGWRRRGEYCFAWPYEERAFHRLTSLDRWAEHLDGLFIIEEEISETFQIPRILTRCRSSYWQWVSNREEFFHARTLDLHHHADVMEFESMMEIMDRTRADNEKLWGEVEYILGVH